MKMNWSIFFFQFLLFFGGDVRSVDFSAIRFKIVSIVAVRGFILRDDDRVVRSLTALEIGSSDFFALLDSSSRRRRSIT